MARKKVSAQDEQAIVEAFRASGKSQTAFAKERGFSQPVLSRMCKRVAATEHASNQTDKTETSDSDAVSNPDHAALVKRLFRATDQQISHLEAQLADGDALIGEKEARTLGTIARTLDKIMELSPKLTSDTDQAERANEDENQPDTSNLDALRAELSGRLDRLQRSTESCISGDAKRK